MTQLLYGFHISAPDGSKSGWKFFNQPDHIEISIKLQNGAFHHYNSDLMAMSLDHWCFVREFRLETVQYQFDPETMQFTEVIDQGDDETV